MLGKQLKELRLSYSLNQVQLAKQLSVSKQTISNWENDNIPPSIDALVRLAEYFCVSTDYLLGRDNKRTLDVNDLSDIQIAHLQNLINDLRSK